MSQNFMLAGDLLSLDRIRSVLTRLEDTIIFSLIERAQFAHNPRIYQRSAFKQLKDLGFHGSWLEWFLKEIESFHGAFLRCYPPPVDVNFHTSITLQSSQSTSLYQVSAPLSTKSPRESVETNLAINPARMNTRSAQVFLNLSCRPCPSPRCFTQMRSTSILPSYPSTPVPSFLA